MFLVILLAAQFSNAQIVVQPNPVQSKINFTLREIEDTYDLFCTEKTKPGFSFSHFSFCSGDATSPKPCAKKTVYLCKNRAGDVVKKVKTWVTFDSNGSAKKLLKIKISN